MINHFRVRNIKGFTLIELLVVVAIIGILAAVGVVAYNGYTKAAKINATKANHKVVAKYFQNSMKLCSLGRNPMEYVSWPQCERSVSTCGEGTGVGSFQAHFGQKFRCEIKNPYNSNEGFTYNYPQYSNSPTPSVVGRMHISTPNPKTITLITKWGEGQNDILTTVITQD